MARTRAFGGVSSCIALGALAVAFSFLPAKEVSASGFAIGLHGAKAVGIGLAGGSALDDATVNFYNPASLGNAEGHNDRRLGQKTLLLGYHRQVDGE